MRDRFDRTLSVVGLLSTLVPGYLATKYLFLSRILVADGDPIPQGAIGAGIGLLALTLAVLVVFPRYDELVRAPARRTALLVGMFAVLSSARPCSTAPGTPATGSLIWRWWAWDFEPLFLEKLPHGGSFFARSRRPRRSMS